MSITQPHAPTTSPGARRNSECPARRQEGPVATPTHAGGARPCRAHVCHPSALPGVAEPHTLRSSAGSLQLLSGVSPRPTVCPGPGQDWGSCTLCWEGTSACGSNTCWKEEESDPGAGNRPGPLELGAHNPRGQRLRVAELVLALGRSLVPPWPDQAWGTGCIYIFVGYFALIKAVPALMLPA